MSEVPEIVDLEKVVVQHPEVTKLHTYTSRLLKKSVDNYGSILIAIDSRVETTDNPSQRLDLVAKIPPIDNDYLWKMFMPERTCLTENAVYKYLAPVIKSFEEDAKIPYYEQYDGLAEYYGFRISADDKATVVDKTAVLLLENLQSLDFTGFDRFKMFNYEHAKLILKYVAKFHAFGVAYRLQKPEEFDKIRPYFRRLNAYSNLDDERKEELKETLLDNVYNATNGNTVVVHRTEQIIKEFDELQTSPDREDGMFTTIVHFELWPCNLMIKYNKHEVPCEVKLIDFQMAQYESLVYDLIFLMFSSFEPEVLDNHTNELLLFYYNEFIKCLHSIEVTTEEYCFLSFMTEVHKYAPTAICYTLFMTRVIFEDMNQEDRPHIHNEYILKRTADIIRLARKYRMFFFGRMLR